MKIGTLRTTFPGPLCSDRMKSSEGLLGSVHIGRDPMEELA